MKYDSDRLAHLAGIKSASSSNSRKEKKQIREGREIKRLRQIVRQEAKKILSTPEKKVLDDTSLVERAQKSKSLTEAMTTLGFAGPGFGGEGPAFGTPMTSARKLASIKESECDHGDLDGDEEIDFDVEARMAEPDLPTLVLSSGHVVPRDAWLAAWGLDPNDPEAALKLPPEAR